jgi:hypothetical protein
MAYSYSGDPESSDLDRYRFAIGDTGDIVGIADSTQDATPLDEYFPIDNMDATPVDATPLEFARDNFILSNEEITFILNNYTSHNTRMYYLFNSCANILGRQIKRSLGPQYEDPTSRTDAYAKQAAEYKKLMTAGSGLSLPVYGSDKIFSKGMHDNV